MSMPEITWDRSKLALFKQAYQQAVEANLSEFGFEGHKVLTAYAFYLIEYLDSSLAASDSWP